MSIFEQVTVWYVLWAFGWKAAAVFSGVMGVTYMTIVMILYAWRSDQWAKQTESRN